MKSALKTVPATEAKNRFGELLEATHRQAVGISKKGRPVAVMLSIEEYESMQERLGEIEKPADLTWLADWRERMEKARKGKGKPLDEADYREHLNAKFGG
jgi:prevent-host-death family protein